jgi:hypothetical protein
MLKHAEECGIRRIEAEVRTANERGIQLYTKNGFKIDRRAFSNGRAHLVVSQSRHRTTGEPERSHLGSKGDDAGKASNRRQHSMMLESEVQCPFCGEPITVFVDPSQEKQTYIEDCTVCCRPIEMRVTCDPDAGEILSIRIARS